MISLSNIRDFLYDIATIVYLIGLNLAYIVKIIFTNVLMPQKMSHKCIKGDVVLITGAG